ncbi:MAG: hypothetical protein APG12_00304 [Candidatus Methanofastidiosum methylothiophilum]|uniref:Uncharacterized protein n=1 Tax=Candidatus Methanofastidiosum methylothiophilum TaxID=1705564 RepID=A0A150J206_9EURY|nr:MAG: hypothetical protein APG10_00338 [Candidatus Methanofastidiosum methylthiophilus]KYC48617.1 MAG: hypothetical protein APG11_00127 [Candidatus Methanofastidiosum methylthiophilus]KYC51178.1 MAG: hypothetical protein APG12_00304 [Candidatus Methanofastidiosum methylthiophilus]
MGYKIIRKRGPVSKKAQVEVITVMLILAITVAAVFAAYRFAGPQIERSRDVSRINSMQNALLELDKKIREVRFEGEGAQRYIDINFDKGSILTDQNNDTIIFFMDAPGIESAPQQMGMDTYFTGRAINVKLQYGGEIDIISRFEVLNAGQYRIYIKNEGANDVLLSLSPEIPVTGDTWTLQGYVYDNTEGQNETSPTMNTTGNTIDPPLANAEIVFINDKLETIAITRTNSQGRYAVRLPKSDWVNDLKLYIRVNLTSYVMKENEGQIYTKTDLYKLNFAKNLGPWIVNMSEFIAAPKNDFESYYDANNFFNIPMYKLTKQDIFESIPIALVMYNTENFDNLLFDTMDAFDATSDSNYHCNYFVLYGSVDSPVGLNGINYPGTTINVQMYPIKWLLDPTERRSPSEYGTLDPRFAEIAAIDGNPDILNYRDFSLIIVGSGATNDPNLLPKLNSYRGDLTNFLALNRLSFKGVDYSRGLITFGQFSIDSASAEPDPDNDNYYPHPSVLSDLDPPRILNPNIITDDQNSSGIQLPSIWINGDGGKIVFYSNITDVSSIIHAGVNIYREADGVLVGGKFLFDNGITPDRLAQDNTFSTEWPVPGEYLAGIYQVRFQSTDEQGNFIERSSFYTNNPASIFRFEIKKDAVLPSSSVITPIITSPTISPYTRIDYSASDALSGIDKSMYQTQVLQFVNNPIWTDPHNYYYYLPLSEGDYNYSFVTYDRAQNTLLTKIEILRDRAPPLILSKSPETQALNSTPVIFVNYDDLGAGILGSRLYLDGDYKISSNTNSITHIPAADINDGTHTSTVYIEDTLGNFLVNNWSFYFNNPGPNLTISQPQTFLTFTNQSSINFIGSTPASSASWDVNSVAPAFSLSPNPSFSFNVNPLTVGLNIIRVKVDGEPTGSDQNDTYATRWVIYDNSNPNITINAPTSVNPQTVRAGGKAYITFTYTEKYPASYIIRLRDGSNTILETAPRVITTPNLNYVTGGGTHTIMDEIDIPSNVIDGNLYGIEIIMRDLAGNEGSSLQSNILRAKKTGPIFSNLSPGQNDIVSTTAPITLDITDSYAGVDRNSIRMFIIGKSSSNASVINMEVTNNIKIDPLGLNDYRVSYTPIWPWENTYKIEVRVEASDKLGNRSQTSDWYYITRSLAPTIKNLSMEHRAQEGATVSMNFTIDQCKDKIKEVEISIGKIGKIRYAMQSPGSLVLIRDESYEYLPGSGTINVNTSGVCAEGTQYVYSFNNITFTIPYYAGDTNNKIFITAINENNWESTYDSYIITSKQRYNSPPNTYYYGKYSWLPTFQGSDLSIGRVSTEPIGESYKIYGELNDVHRNLPVIYTAWQNSRGPPGNPNTITTQQWSGALYIDKYGNRIEWDHGDMPEGEFFFGLDGQAATWPRGRPFQGLDWLNDLNLNLNIGNKYNLQKSSLENPITFRLPNEFAMCTHGYFDIRDTGWTNNNIIFNLKTFDKIYEVKGDPNEIPVPSGPFRVTGGTIFVPQATGGPVLMVKERRNIFNNLESAIIVTTLDLDRYKNNRTSMGTNMHPNEVYVTDARKLQQNIIVYACGHEILID